MFIFRSVLISLCIHTLVLVALSLVPSLLTPKTSENVEISLDEETQFLHALKIRDQSIVRQALVPDRLKAPDDETLPRFLSEKEQRVREETQAAISGMTSNRSKSSTTKSPAKNSSKNSASAANLPSASNDVGEYVDISKQLAEMRDFENGVSTVGESLPQDVKIGSFTALNTDRYVYYTFYARIEELIRYRWESRVQHVIANMNSQMVAGTADRNWVTHAEFLLDPRGYLKKAYIMKESGIRAFDAAAINAFKDAKVFPNPPPELIKDDGYIHIQFSFTVNYSPPEIIIRN